MQIFTNVLVLAACSIRAFSGVQSKDLLPILDTQPVLGGSSHSENVCFWHVSPMEIAGGP